jgi:GDP/UDP-N,N'-diacetylbacillosamine 2-epimerase (hydrolysing)
MIELLEACKEFKKLTFIFTKSNADTDGRIINKLLDEYSNKNSNFHVFMSLGSEKYLNCMKHSSIIIGNSSSGIIEAPSFGIPTINIGDRQKGRTSSKSIINCKPIKLEIIKSINKALTNDFKIIARNTVNPYEGVNTSNKILNVLEIFLFNEGIDLKKKFYDI